MTVVARCEGIMIKRGVHYMQSINSIDFVHPQNKIPQIWLDCKVPSSSEYTEKAVTVNELTLYRIFAISRALEQIAPLS